jgi:hypothetical protein
MDGSDIADCATGWLLADLQRMLKAKSYWTKRGLRDSAIVHVWKM